MSRASVLAATNLSNSTCCEFTRRMSAAPRMLSLMTLFSQSMASCPRLKSARTRRRTSAKVTPTNGSTASTASARRQSMARSSTLAPRIRNTDEMSEAITCDDESLHRVDVRRQVGEERRRRHLLDIGMILCRDSADEPRPQIPRDSFRGIGLDDALEVGEGEDAEGGQQECGRDPRRHRRVAAVTVDGGGDEARDEQVERVAGNRQQDEARDGAAVGREQPSQASRRSRGCWCRRSLRHEAVDRGGGAWSTSFHYAGQRVVARPAAAYIRPSFPTCPEAGVTAARSGQTNRYGRQPLGRAFALAEGRR